MADLVDVFVPDTVLVDVFDEVDVEVTVLAVEPDTDDDSVCAGLPDTDDVTVAAAVPVAVSLAVADALGVVEGDAPSDRDALAVMLAVEVGVPVTVSVDERVPVTVSVDERVPVRVPDVLSLTEAEMLAV